MIKNIEVYKLTQVEIPRLIIRPVCGDEVENNRYIQRSLRNL